jgi:MFS family permease
MPIAVVNVAITILSLFFIDKVGRKKLLLISLTGMTISAALLGCAFVFDGASWMAVVGLVAYVASFAVGLGPVFWVLIAEIYPQRVRGEAMSVATGANWGANFAVALLFPVIVSALGESTSFFMFAIASVGAIVFTLRLVPETMGKSLEEIEAELIPAGT